MFKIICLIVSNVHSNESKNVDTFDANILIKETRNKNPSLRFPIIFECYHQNNEISFKFYSLSQDEMNRKRIQIQFIKVNTNNKNINHPSFLSLLILFVYVICLVNFCFKNKTKLIRPNEPFCLFDNR